MNPDIFKLAELTDDLAIIRVEAKDSLAVARHPYVRADWDYVTVTRGMTHTLTAVDAFGAAVSFDWGAGACGGEPPSRTMAELKKQVLAFLEDKGVLLECTTDRCSDAGLYWNVNFGKWLLSFHAHPAASSFRFSYPNTEKGALDAMAEAMRRFPAIKGFKPEANAAGLQVWKAKLDGPGAVFRPEMDCAPDGSPAPMTAKQGMAAARRLAAAWKRAGEEALAAVKATDGAAFAELPEALMAPAVCEAAVGADGMNLEFVPEALKTEELCRAAVEKSPCALQFVPRRRRTAALCRMAVSLDEAAAEFVPPGRGRQEKP